MKRLRKILATFLAFALCINVFTIATFAAEDTAYYSSDIHLSESDQQFLEKVVSVSEFYYIENNEIKISLSKNELIHSYGFTEEDYTRFADTVIGTYIPTQDVQTRAFVEGGTLYITHEDLSAGVFAILVTAATAGPAAMAAALATLSTMVAGPVGTLVATIAGALSAPSLIELCVKVTQAVATGQGLYIRPVLSYPPFDFGFWG